MGASTAKGNKNFKKLKLNKNKFPDIKTIEYKKNNLKNANFAIVISKFNDFITEELLNGAIENLIKNKINKKNITVVKVPGAYEIPVTVKNLLNKKKYSVIITLGAVIKGETPHFDYICNFVSSEIGRLSVESGVPVIFGVITTNNIKQALDRCSKKQGNKGFEAAQAAIEMINVVVGINSK